ncbi:MAG: lysophospholipase, partial [Spirochaetales bacterium]
MESFNLQTADGLALYGEYRSPETPRALVVVAHGIGEHCGRYTPLADALVASGLAVLTYDHRGHGRSEGQRAFIRSWDQYDNDLALAVAEARRRSPSVPWFLLGHSLGGAIVLDYLVCDYAKPAGVIASAPALGTPGISSALLFLARIASRIAPRLSLDTGLDADNLSRDPVVVEAYRCDPLVHGKGTARLGTELTRAQKRIFDGLGSIDVPLLFIYGDSDKIAAREPIERALAADRAPAGGPAGH